MALLWCFWLSVHILIRPLKSTHRFGHLLVFSSFTFLLFVSGFLSATVRTHTISTPVLAKKMRAVDVIGTVLSIEKMEEGDGSRVILSDLQIERLEPADTPRKVRLRLRADGDVVVGQRIKALALLNPPSPPLLPGAFDFRRYLYFQSVGAVGFIYNAPEILNSDRVRWAGIESLRHSVAGRITDALDSNPASIALALVVGQKNSLSDEDRQAVRDAGLAHMLAISGLHVGLASGVLFFFLRLLLVCIPGFALYYPAKKIAAVFALCGAFFYMLMAGATIPTQRAVLMIAIVFLAIILDRSPISLRLVAFSALVILIIAPESLVSASFHMSFAAVTCLIYFYEVTRRFWIEQYKEKGWYRKILLYFVGVCMTTIIASIATAPFALYHFGQVSYLGSLANLVAVPLLAFIIMPFALLSLIVMPLGLEHWPLQIVGLGTHYILEISYWAASLPLAVIRTPAWGFVSFALLVLASLFMILWKGWGKVFALPFMAVSFLLAYNQVRPNILVASSHKLFAFKQVGRPELLVSSRRHERFVLKNWEKYYGLEEKSSDVLPYKGAEQGEDNFYRCGEAGCRMIMAGHNVSFIRQPHIQNEECAWADIIISVEPMIMDYNQKNRCKAEFVIDKFDSWENGAYALWVGQGGVKVEHVAETTSNRPWSAY